VTEQQAKPSPGPSHARRRWGMVQMAIAAQTMKIQVPNVREDMMMPPITAPELMPVLSRGKHRNPRRGACFMEMGRRTSVTTRPS
jgi:hypothetical protein